MDVAMLLRRSVGFNGDRLAVIAGEERVTFNQAWRRSKQMANGLRASGVNPKDPVAVLEENSLRAVDMYVGAAIANNPRVPLYARNLRETHIQMLNNARAKALVVDEKFSNEVEHVRDEVPTLETVIVRDASYEDWLSDQSDEDPMTPIDPQDLFIIRHTGGTTGMPRGAALTHEMWWRAARDWFYLLPPPERGDRFLHIGPISHASGFLLLPIWVGGGVQIMAAGLDASEVVDVMAREKVSYTFLPPTLLNMAARGERASDGFPALKSIITGSAPISEETIKRAQTFFGADKLWQLYGSTEACPDAGMGPSEWFAEREGSHPTTAAGVVFPWAEVEIRDEDRRSLPIGEIGEIWVRSDNSIREYYNAPDETAHRVIDGFVATGDIGRIDANGYLYLVDRKNDLIISGGFNIYPGELENAIASHSDIIEVAVFGVPHEKWGETPAAVCYVLEGAEVTESDIIDLVATRLGSYKKPSVVELRNEPLPKSPVGKILRRALREPYWGDRDRSVSGA